MVLTFLISFTLAILAIVLLLLKDKESRNLARYFAENQKHNTKPL